MRNCKRCEYKGPKETFPESGVHGDKKYYRHVCKACHVQQKVVRRQINRELINDIKKKVKCVRCGNKDWRVIDWHHVDPNTKLFIIGNSNGRGLSVNTIIREIEKCTPLCANCHRIVEYEIRHNVSG